MAREKCLPTCEWIRFVADVHSAVPAEGLARDGRVKHVVGKVLSALDDRVLNGRIDPYVSALFENQSRTLAGELFRTRKAAKLTLMHTLQLHSAILSLSTMMSLSSKGLSTLTATVTAPQWHEP